MRALIAILLLTTGCDFFEMRARRKEVQRLVPLVRALADSLDQERRAGLVAAAAGAVASRPDLGACPEAAHFPIGETDERVIKTIAGLVSSPLLPLSLLGAGVTKTSQLATASGPRRQIAEIDLDKAAHALAGDDEPLQGDGGASFVDELRKESERAWWRPDLTLAADLYLPPARRDLDGSGDNTFQSGLVGGRVFVWSYAEHKVICAGVAAGGSSSKVTVGVLKANGSEVGNFDLGEVQRDVQFNALERALGELHRAGPPLPSPQP